MGKGGPLQWASGSKAHFDRNVQRFRGGLVFKAHKLVSLNSRIESNTDEEKKVDLSTGPRGLVHLDAA